MSSPDRSPAPADTPFRPGYTPLATADYSSEVFRSPSPRLLDQVREQIRLRHDSTRTADPYLFGIRTSVLFHQYSAVATPAGDGAREVEAFLTHFAVAQATAATQNQAWSAIPFLYRHVLAVELSWVDDVVRAKRPARLPVLLTRGEVQGVLERQEH